MICSYKFKEPVSLFVSYGHYICVIGWMDQADNHDDLALSFGMITTPESCGRQFYGLWSTHRLSFQLSAKNRIINHLRTSLKMARSCLQPGTLASKTQLLEQRHSRKDTADRSLPFLVNTLVTQC